MRWITIEANQFSESKDRTKTEAMLIPGGVLVRTERQLLTQAGIGISESTVFVPGNFALEKDKNSSAPHLGIHNIVLAETPPEGPVPESDCANAQS